MPDKLPDINEDGGQQGGKFMARNWKKKNDKDLNRLGPQQKSKYFAYEEPPKDVAEKQEETRKRLRERKKEKTRIAEMNDRSEEIEERNKHEKLIGQLKAAEARNRIRIMRLRYESNRSEEVNHLISCQPNARNAVRLQALIPIKNQHKLGSDMLDKLERGRVESLLEDTQGLITGRT